ncbi:hypothetical protein [Alteromonas sp. BMJM2]|uniref:hypothetical protein n=1 Tax=Alteromonas sp. BMJM2 TaxID=2954241 RepID=UPI0022B30657|nr:hypothetical protein [Alteromonas sp. BMJM2]
MFLRNDESDDTLLSAMRDGGPGSKVTDCNILNKCASRADKLTAKLAIKLADNDESTGQVLTAVFNSSLPEAL